MCLVSHPLSAREFLETTLSAHPCVTQSALLVAGILGIVVFKEVKGKKKITGFLACGCTLMCGAALLAVYGQCKAPKA